MVAWLRFVLVLVVVLALVVGMASWALLGLDLKAQRYLLHPRRWNGRGLADAQEMTALRGRAAGARYLGRKYGAEAKGIATAEKTEAFLAEWERTGVRPLGWPHPW
ncbi:hypothetical protein AB0M43_34900 [Longispora sp. NPDC051575]|uniref:hypothetical protein n=1 Tax=Longispora sp. NPDC051575 TaxID=3154943 RepID=UPI00343EA326